MFSVEAESPQLRFFLRLVTLSRVKASLKRDRADLRRAQLFSALALLCLIRCGHTPPATSKQHSPSAPREQPVHRIPLAGPIAAPEAELSGLAWYQDRLLLLPQYPARFGSPGALFTLTRKEIEAWLGCQLPHFERPKHCPKQLTPRALPFDDSGVRAQHPRFEGYEALVVHAEQCYLSAELSGPPHDQGLLFKGTLHEDPLRIRIDPHTALRARLPRARKNSGLEALLHRGTQLYALYERNGRLPARVLRVDLSRWRFLDPQPMAQLPYRLTDASAADPQGRFWVSNYHWPGNTPEPRAHFQPGPTHQRYPAIEHLVALRHTDQGIAKLPVPPIQLVLSDTEGRNWEGLVRLGSAGFLLVTDKHPDTQLAFVAAPAPRKRK